MDDLIDIQHIPGTLNIADLGMRGFARLRDMGMDSEWQQGLAFLREKYELWPTTSEAILHTAMVPSDEFKKKNTSLHTVSLENGAKSEQKVGPIN